MPKKRTKAVDIVGRWSYKGDNIVKYDKITKDMKCSKCDGTDVNCTLCHGQSIEKKPRWYQLKKRFEKWLENL